MNEAVHRLQEEHGLIFRKLMKNPISIGGYSAASFAGNGDLSSQIGTFVLLVDESNVTGVIHYASWKCRQWPVLFSFLMGIHSPLAWIIL